jgi:hypothetical protein
LIFEAGTAMLRAGFGSYKRMTMPQITRPFMTARSREPDECRCLDASHWTVLLLALAFAAPGLPAQSAHPPGAVADKPLFRDPVHDGAADPEVVYNRERDPWFIFYTNRRANVQGL